MPRRLIRPAVAGLALVLAVPVVAGCHGVDDALHCGKRAVSIAGDVQDLQAAATNVGQLTDASRRHNTVAALQKIGADLQKIGDTGNQADVNKAVDDLSAAVRNAQNSVSQDRQPDLTPIGDAAGELSKACADS